MSLSELYMQTKFGKDYASIKGNMKKYIDGELNNLKNDPIVSARITLKLFGDPREYVLVDL